MKPRYFILLLLILVILIFVIDVIRITGYQTNTKRGDHLKSQQDQVYCDLVNGSDSIDWNRLNRTLEYVSNEFDCSDFRLVNLIRILYEYEDQIPLDYKSKIEKVLFNFRYWWDEPGENSMCYWSENHQILFASAEYLVGQKYPAQLFPKSGLAGKEHMNKARKRILDWLEMRWNHGFIEYYSAAYYPEDIGALINLIDLADDEEITAKCKIILDLLMYDVAAQNINEVFTTTTGRAYERGRKGAEGVSDLRGLTRYFWGDGEEVEADMVYALTKSKNYMLPPVLKEIARDSSDVVIRQSNGLDISDLKAEGYYGLDDRSMMMQWGMECFTNPEIISNSISHVRKCNMFSNKFVAGFKYVDFTLIRIFNLAPLISRMLNFQTDGAAIQRGNTYTFKTKDYTLYTTQSYHPGTYGAQQHITGMNIGTHFSIFHTHPALEKDAKFSSPSYWVGYGHLPHAVQDGNVSLSIYNIPSKKALMEIALLDYTHAFFPSENFDTTFVDGRYAFGKNDETYCVFIGANNLEFREGTTDDIIQNGKQIFWIIEAGSKEQDGSFKKFVKRVKNNKVNFNPEMLVLEYQSNDKNLQLKFGGDFRIDNKIVNTEYSRYDSPYVKAEKKDSTLSFSFNGKSLFLDFYNMKRVY